MKKLVLGSLVALLIIISAGASKNLLASVVFPTSCENLQDIIDNVVPLKSVSSALQESFDNTKVDCPDETLNFYTQLSYGAVADLVQITSLTPSTCYVGSVMVHLDGGKSVSTRCTLAS